MMPLRVRLTLVYLALAALALGSFALAVYLIASKNIYQNLDDGMSSRAQAVIQTFQPLSQPISEQNITQLRQDLGQEAALGTVFQIRDLGGSILYSSVRTGSGPLPAPKSAQPGGPTFSTGKVQGRRLRVLSEPITSGGGQQLGTLELAQPLSETDEALNEIRYVSIIGGLVVLVVASASAYWLAGRALDPVRQASRLARDIERTADFSRRLPSTGAAGEMRELVTTLNAMISRIERTLVAQRAFLADSSHELRRPLTVLRTNIDVMKNPGLSADERAACLSEMSAEAGSMSRLLSDLLLLSREVPQAIERASVDYSSLCEETVARLRTQDVRHKLQAQVAPAVRVMGDRERLAQMLWNLLENAAQYTPAGGRIEFRLERVNGQARVEVEDTGVGIAEQDQSRVFERFYRGELARTLRTEGVGLGLSIVKYVAEAHGGAVEITSRLGQGSRFVVDLPTLV
jgi:two-component system OmpR family sensor kinase